MGQELAQFTPYLMHIATLAGIVALISLSFNLAVGYTGLVNFGHIGLLGVGGYTSAILLKTYGAPFPLALLASMVLAAVVAGLLALPARKIRGDYYALVTLGFLFVVSAVFMNWQSLTRGTLGIHGIPRPAGFTENDAYLFLVLVLVGGVYAGLQRVVRSPFGRALEAVRDDEEVAAALGKPVFKLKVLSLMMSGAIVGMAGALLASFVHSIDPQSFWLDLVIWSLATVVVGGLASMRGALVGTFFLFLLTEPIKFIDVIPSSHEGAVRVLVFSLVLLLVVLFKPKGFLGRAQLEG